MAPKFCSRSPVDRLLPLSQEGLRVQILSLDVYANTSRKALCKWCDHQPTTDIRNTMAISYIVLGLQIAQKRSCTQYTYIKIYTLGPKAGIVYIFGALGYCGQSFPRAAAVWASEDLRPTLDISGPSGEVAHKTRNATTMMFPFG